MKRGAAIAAWLALVSAAAAQEMKETPPAAKAEGAKNESAPTAKKEKSKEEFDAATFMRRTKEFLPNAAEALARDRQLAGGLLLAGKQTAAMQLLRGVKFGVDERVALAKQLLGRGQAAAAESILTEVARQAPTRADVALLRVAARAAEGNYPLAQREATGLRFLGGRTTPEDAAYFDFLDRLLALGHQAGVERNPWGVKFPQTVSGGEMELPPDEAVKLPASAAAHLARWLEASPLQPPLWGMMAQVLWAQKQPDEARECLERARALLYLPPAVRSYLVALDKAAAKREAEVMKSLGGAAGGGGSSAPAPTGPPPEVRITESSVQVFAVIGIGGFVLGLLAGLQIAGRRRRRPGG